MVRWQPGARERLGAAALDAFVDAGFEQTTVAQIAARAGVTERTFYRYFTDKREVLFDGSSALQNAMVAAVADAPAAASPAALVSAALDAIAAIFTPERRAFSRRRSAVLAAEPALQERELLKLDSLAAALEHALAARGIRSADIVAQSALAVFTVAFQRWIAEGEARGLGELQAEVRGELAAWAMD